MEALNEQQYPLVKLVLEQALEPELVRVVCRVQAGAGATRAAGSGAAAGATEAGAYLNGVVQNCNYIVIAVGT